MHDRRIKDLANDLYDHVFQMLDSEPEIGGEEAGRIATNVQMAFEQSFHEYGEDHTKANELGFDTPDDMEDAFLDASWDDRIESQQYEP